MKKNFTLIGIIALTSCASFPKSPKYFSPVLNNENIHVESIKIPKSDLSCYPGFTQIRVDWCTLREGGKIEKNAKDLAGWVSYAFTGKNPFYNIKKKIHQTQFIDIH